MLYSPVFAPLPHGEVGLLDELLLFGAPLITVIIILAIASRRARKNAQSRERSPRDTSNNLPSPPKD